MTSPASRADAAPYVFDFDTEVDRTCALFPTETKNLLFMKLAYEVPELDRITQTLVRLHKETGQEVTTTDKLMLEAKARELFVSAHCGGVAYKSSHGVNHGILGMGFKQTLPVFGIGSEKDKFFRFYHELGHLIVRGGTRDMSGYLMDNLPTIYEPFLKNSAENVGDTFALMMGLHLGVLDADDIAHIAASRSFKCLLENDLIHLTTPNLLHLHDTAVKGGIENLTPQQIRDKAMAYGWNVVLEVAAVEKVRDIYTPEKINTPEGDVQTWLNSMTREERKDFAADLKLGQSVLDAKLALCNEITANGSRCLTEAALASPVFCKTIGAYFNEKAAKLTSGSTEHIFTCAAARAAQWGLHQ